MHEAREAWSSVSDVEKETIPQSKSQHCHQGAWLSSISVSVLLYGAETWAVTQQDIQKLKTFKMRSSRDILGFTHWNMQQNTVILEKTGELPVED